MLSRIKWWRKLWSTTKKLFKPITRGFDVFTITTRDGLAIHSRLFQVKNETKVTFHC